MKYASGPGRKAFQTLNALLLSLTCLSILLPIWMVLATSVSPNAQVIRESYVFFPSAVDLSYYRSVLQSGYFSAFLRSIAVTVAGTVASMALTLPMGYALAQKDLWGRSFFLKMVLLTMLFDGGIIPFYMVVRNLGLIDSYAALVLPVALSTYNLILVKNYMASIPPSLIDAGRIDGCGEMRILAYVILPVSTPILAAVGLFYAVTYWNTYFEVVMFINSSSKYTLQVLLRQLIFESESITSGAEQIYNNFKMTVMVMAVLPIALIYPYIQRHFVTGLMLGSLKE